MKLSFLLNVSIFTTLLTYSLHTTGEGISNVSPGEITNPTTTSASEIDITDQDRYESQIYLHEGIINTEVKQECDKLEDGVCTGSAKTKFLGVDGDIIKMAAKAYTLVMGMSGIGGEFKKRQPSEQNAETKAGEVETSSTADTKTESGGDSTDKPGADSESETVKDYCKYIPVATETLALFMQQSEQNMLSNAPENQESAQKDLLYKAVRSHEARAKTAQIQATGFTATTACYTYLATKVQVGWNIISKIGASGLLSWFFWNEKAQQNQHADDVKAIADNLPGRGDCNPITQTNCFCSHEESKQDANNYYKYCVSKEIQNNTLTPTSYNVACIDANLKADGQCTCINQETCFDKKYFSDIEMPGFGGFLSTPAAQDFASLTKGELVGGNLEGNGLANAAASQRNLKNALNNLKITENPPRIASPNADDVLAVTAAGFPKKLAQVLSSLPESSKFKSNLGSSTPKYAVARKANGQKNNILRFNQASGLNLKRNKSSNSNNINKFAKKKKGGAKNNVLSFSEKARKAAEINKDSGRSIFEIISQQYFKSAKGRLGIY